jgi:hypothetical protein
LAGWGTLDAAEGAGGSGADAGLLGGASVCAAAAAAVGWAFILSSWTKKGLPDWEALRFTVGTLRSSWIDPGLLPPKRESLLDEERRKRQGDQAGANHHGVTILVLKVTPLYHGRAGLSNRDFRPNTNLQP